MKIIFFFYALFMLSVAFAVDVVIADELVQKNEWNEFLRKNPDYISVTDYLASRDLQLTLGLDSFLEDCEKVLQKEISYKEFQHQVILAKKVAFGKDHRQIWLDTLEKLSLNAASKEKSLIQQEHQFQFQFAIAGATFGESAKKVDFKNFSRDWLNFPTVLIDGIEMPSSKIPFITTQNTLRYYFISRIYQPILFVGTQKELANQKPSLTLLTEHTDPLTLENHWFKLNREGTLVALDSEMKAESSWWKENKKWALPVLGITAAAAAYSLSQENLEFEWFSF